MFPFRFDDEILSTKQNELTWSDPAEMGRNMLRPYKVNCYGKSAQRAAPLQSQRRRYVHEYSVCKIAFCTYMRFSD
jgi:hypothetical protein